MRRKKGYLLKVTQINTIKINYVKVRLRNGITSTGYMMIGMKQIITLNGSATTWYKKNTRGSMVEW